MPFVARRDSEDYGGTIPQKKLLTVIMALEHLYVIVVVCAPAVVGGVVRRCRCFGGRRS